MPFSLIIPHFEILHSECLFDNNIHTFHSKLAVFRNNGM